MNGMTEDARLIEDEKNRQRALATESFIVEAPAGAGKTELLTQRYLRLLAEVDAPEEILAITFTNKAAAEMRHRILSSLEVAASGEEPVLAHKRITFHLARAALQKGWPLIEQPQRLRILTIDALSAMLARQMPFLSRFGRQPVVSDDANRHYLEAAQRTLSMLADNAAEGDEAGSGTADADIVAEALRHLDNNVARLAGLLADMLAKREQWLRHCQAAGGGAGEEAESALATLALREISRVAKIVDPRRQQRLMPVARFAADNVADDAPQAALRGWTDVLPVTREALPQWRGLCELLLTAGGTFRKKLDKNSGFPAGKEFAPQKEALLEVIGEFREEEAGIIQRLRTLPDARYSEADRATVEILARLLHLAAGQLWLLFGEAGEVDFVEVAQRALNALGQEDAPTDLALQLDYRIRHLLVDEFQDTSPLQTELLARLTAGWQPNDGRTLFAVGDPMQSIYRFRKAEVGLFLSVAENGIGDLRLERLNLYRNNRSCAAVIDWINRSFCHIFPAGDVAASGAIRYRPFSTGRHDLDALPGAGIHVHALIGEGEAANQEEAARILELIRSQQAEAPDQRIAVLVRARSHLEALVAMIRREAPGLRFQAVEIESLARRQTVQDLLSLTRALLHRGDRLHLLAVLRAPWCGLTLSDLHALAGDDHEATVCSLMNDEARVARLSLDGQTRLHHVRDVLDEAWSHQGRARLSRWVEGVWLRLGGAACLARGGEAGEMNDVRAYFDLLDRLDAAGRFDLDSLEDAVGKLYAAPDPLADDRLQFMTIHKSKGLEFDVVILPGLHRTRRGDDPSLVLWEEVVVEDDDGPPRARLLAAPYDAGRRKEKGRPPSAYDYLREIEKERSKNEDMRVLYVAVTRAIRKLHLFGVARLDKEGQPLAPAGSFLEMLQPVDGVVEAFRRAAEEAGQLEGAEQVDVAVAPEEKKPFIPSLVRLRQAETPGAFRERDAIGQAGTGSVSRNEEAAPGEEGAGTGNLPALDPLAADIGILLHLYLELMAGTELAAWDAKRLGSLKPVMRQWFARRGQDASRCEEGVAQVMAALQTTLNSEAGRWLLSQHTEAASELALTRAEGRADTHRHRYRMNVVDRCFVADGVRWIVDYKTARVGEESDEEPRDEPSVATLRVHAGNYREQLERYSELFTGEGLPQQRAIFYARYGKLVVLDSPGCAD